MASNGGDSPRTLGGIPKRPICIVKCVQDSAASQRSCQMDCGNLRKLIFAAAIGLGLVAAADGQTPRVRLQIDATNEPNPALKGMQGLPSSINAPTLPIRLRLTFPRVADARENVMLVDFTLLNVGKHPVELAIFTDGTQAFSCMLRLVLTSPDGKIRSTMMPWCAELYSQVGDRASITTLAPKEAMIVHARCRFPAPSDQVSLTAHAERIDLGHGMSSLVGIVHSTASLYTPPR